MKLGKRFALDFARKPTVAKALELEEVLREATSQELAAAKDAAWAHSEYTRAALADRYEPGPHDLEGAAPASRQGRWATVYGNHMLENNLSPDFYQSIEKRRPMPPGSATGSIRRTTSCTSSAGTRHRFSTRPA